jgi:hypothetical protein
MLSGYLTLDSWVIGKTTRIDHEDHEENFRVKREEDFCRFNSGEDGMDFCCIGIRNSGIMRFNGGMEGKNYHA